MHRRWDVLVVGAGPAGAAAAAWLARAGASVALVHRIGRPLERIEALGPDLPALLGRVGLKHAWLRELASPCPGVSSHWADPRPETIDYLLSPHGPTWSVRRAVFDERLRAQAQAAGATLLAVRRVRSAGPDEWRLDGEAVSATNVLVAYGGERADAGAGPVTDRLIALTRTFGVYRHSDRRLLIEAAQTGWWYGLPGPDGCLGLGFITDRDTLHGHRLEAVWRRALAEAPHAAAVAATASAPGPLRPVPVRCGLSAMRAGTATWRIGNALAAYDPLTGRGVAESLRSALEVAAIVGGAGSESLTTQRIAQHYALYLAERRRFYAIGAARFRTAFWMRRETAGVAA